MEEPELKYIRRTLKDGCSVLEFRDARDWCFCIHPVSSNASLASEELDELRKRGVVTIWS
jgi:hypothetical protein